jgi:gamma-glutamylcyclotransferase (GGCT)/AIG2-like uncharacterized protein YtfP
MTEKIFVYGTLRPRGEEATHILSGFDLYLYSWFPFIKPGKGSVKGNIKRVAEGDLPALDRYEGVPNGLYERIQVKVVNINKDKETKAWVYVPKKLLENDDREFPIINSGDWFNRG